jgi:hypothetical protein
MTTLQQAKNRVDGIFNRYVSGMPSVSLIPPRAVAGKVYEALVLCYLAENLVQRERYRLRLVGGGRLYLKTAPGPINLSYPHFEAFRGPVHIANVFTDVEFATLSCRLARKPAPTTSGDYHELDIVVVEPAAHGRPWPDELWLGIECKHTVYAKNLLREALGLRRELSLLAPPRPTNFTVWPQTVVPADPPVCLMTCSSDARVKNFSAPGSIFGIDFCHVPI